MRTILALARKDLRVLTRVRSGLFFSFVWPLVVAILFGAVFSGQGTATTRAVTVAVVDQDDSAASRDFLARLEVSGDFVLDRLPLEEAVTRVRRGQRAAYVVVAPGFGVASERMLDGDPRTLSIGNDPARQAEASMIEGLLTRHLMADVQALLTNPASSKTMEARALTDFLDARPSGGGASGWQPIRITRVPVTRERLGPANGFEVTFPQGIMWGIIGCVMSFAVGLVSERVRGTFTRLQVAPLTRTQIFAGKALACVLTIAVLQVVIVAIGVGWFGVTPSSYPLLAMACVSASLGFVGFMMMVAGLGRTEQAASGAGWAMLMPMTLFGGGMMPQFVMPAWMQTAGHLSPVKWAILAMEGAVWRGFSFAEMAAPCAILLAFGAVCFAIGVRGLARE